MSKPFCYIFLAFCVLQVNDTKYNSCLNFFKFSILICLFFFVIKISLSARIPRGTTNNAIETNAKNSSSEEENCACKLPKSPADQTDDSSSSEELTEEDIRNITKQLTESEHLSPEKTKQFTEILNKFTKGKSVDENVEGFVSKMFLLFIYVYFLP